MVKRIAFYWPPPTGGGFGHFALALQEGARKHHDIVDVVKSLDMLHGYDAGVFFSISGAGRWSYPEHVRTGRPFLFFDKSYSRSPDTFRVAINEFQPLNYLQKKRRAKKRWERLNISLQNYHTRPGWPILFDGASNKFCRWKNLGTLRAWGEEMVTKIRQHTDREVVYRPRPVRAEKGVENIPGCTYSTGPLDEALAGAGIAISYGGNFGFDAVCAGVPHFAIGDSIARPLSETDWERLDVPRIPTEAERLQWCYDVAYCQWTLAELRDGSAWADMREELFP